LTLGTAPLAEALELYWNGQRLGGLGHFPANARPDFDIFPRSVVVSIPPTPDGHAVIALRLHRPRSHVRYPIQLADSSLFVGSAEAVRARIALHYTFPAVNYNALVGVEWGDWFTIILWSSMNLLGLYFLIAWYSAPEMKGFLWFGINMVGAGIAILLMVRCIQGEISLGVANRLWSLASLVGSISNLGLFLFLARIRSRWLRSLLFGWCALGATWELAFPDRSLQGEFATYLISVVVPILCIVVLKRNYRGANGWLLAAGITPYAIVSFIQSLDTLSHYVGGRFEFPLIVWERQYDGLATIFAIALLALALGLYFQKSLDAIRREKARMGQELTAGSEMQALLLSERPPAFPGWTVEAVYQPAGEVGGDFYRLHHRSDGSLLVVTGDMSGKGLRPAMVVSFLLGVLEECLDLEPGELLAHLNRRLQGRVSGGFVTCCAGILTRDGQCRIANAGHIPPYVDGNSADLEGGLPLGLANEWEGSTMTFPVKDSLLMLSDGVLEAANPTGELFGFDRTSDISRQSAQQIAEAAKAWGQNDDITVVTIRRVS